MLWEVGYENSEEDEAESGELCASKQGYCTYMDRAKLR
jgi:hypothetical protein